MRIVSRILDVITATMFIIGVLLTLFYIRGITPTVVLTGSMSPSIPTGSVCFIDTKFPYNKLKVKDVIVYKFQRNQVIHRIIKITDQGIETKGDANSFSDRISTTPKNYYGKYLFSIPGLGYFTVHMQSTTGKIGFVIVVVSIFVMQYTLRSIVKKGEIKDGNDG